MAEFEQQTTRGTAATAKRGFKRPPSGLVELLRLSNLEPDPSVTLPLALRVEALSQRDDKENVLATVLRWLLDVTADLPDGFRMEMLRYFEARSAHFSNAILTHAVTILMAHYMHLCEIRELFDRLTKGEVPPVVYFWQELEAAAAGDVAVQERVILKVDAEGKLRYRRPPDPLLALEGIILKYLRRCEVCNRFFYACRINQSGCSPSHSATLYKRQQRANKRNKRKRAMSARKR